MFDPDSCRRYRGSPEASVGLLVTALANASEAIYVLDGLLYHGSDLAIDTLYLEPSLKEQFEAIAA